MAIEALGLKKFGDKGNMTKAEIDFLIDYLIPLKKAGHFRAFWENFGQSVNLMVNGEVALESMWSPAVAAIQAEGVPCVYAFPKEGMRGWHGGLCHLGEGQGQAARPGLRVHQLVACRLASRVCRAPGLLSLDPRKREEVPRAGGMGLLVRRQAGGQGPGRIRSAPSSSRRATFAPAALTGTAIPRSRSGIR